MRQAIAISKIENAKLEGANRALSDKLRDVEKSVDRLETQVKDGFDRLRDEMRSERGELKAELTQLIHLIAKKLDLEGR